MVHDSGPAASLNTQQQEWGSCPSHPAMVHLQHGSACTPAVQGMPQMVQELTQNSFSVICLSGLVCGPVPGLFRAFESLLQSQDESFSVVVSSGTCHSGVWVPPKPSQLCSPLAPLRNEEMFLFFHRWRATEYKDLQPFVGPHLS